MKTRAIVLFSGGLDSILSARLLKAQDIEVVCLKFSTPFFGQKALRDPGPEKARYREKYGLDVELVDISDEYVEMLKAPLHGYGRYLNPCLDCKILMVRKARELMPRYGASFIATGEVLGQRPMSQRRDAMRIVERDSGAEGLLVRPLTARRLKPTKVEEDGLVTRGLLLGISGRGRKAQMELAEKFGITDPPTPAGGCVLADPILSQRFRELMKRHSNLSKQDFLLAQVGRSFFLDDDSWLVIGRNELENREIEALKARGDVLITAKNTPGPTALWRFQKDRGLRYKVEALFVNYIKKGAEDIVLQWRLEPGKSFLTVVRT